MKKVFRLALPLLIIPAVVACGAFLHARRYAYVSFAVALLSLALFLCGFEKKKTGTRRLIIVAVMTALSVTGRFIPLFKPVTSLTIITAVYLGGESGFLVGALSALISNFYFGQGPWTPFQMLSLGLIGFFAGILSKTLKKHRAALLVYGLLSGMIYSLIMDIWTVLWYNENFSAALYTAAMITAAPHTIMYSASNVIFLQILSKPFGEKLERIKYKYGV